MQKLEHLFVVPDFSRRISGGNRFNAGLIGALVLRGVPCAVVTDAAPVSAWPSARFTWLDSLYFERFDTWCGRLEARRVGVLMHSLPSQLATAARGTRVTEGPSKPEANTLRRFDHVLAPSELMAEQLRDVTQDVFVVEPARDIPRHVQARMPPADAALRACVVSHLLANKGVLEFLQALDGSSLAAGANIAIIGSDDIEPDYAARCRALVAASPELSRCVHFLGELPYAQTIDYMARSELFVSTSPFESYGMAIAEARALGLPVVARQGGNVKHLVSRDTGGQLCDSARALADSFIALTHDRDALRSRAERAIASRLPARNWSHVADEFTAAST